MNRRSRRSAGWLGVVAAAGLLGGCVERKYVITTEPPGAVVYENGRPLAPSPADGTFLYPGDYDFTVVLDGYQTLKVRQPIPPKWYERFPIDFFSENLWPWTIVDERRFHYVLQPQQTPNVQEVGRQAQELRARGQAIGRTEQ